MNLPIGQPTRHGSAEVIARGTKHEYAGLMNLDGGSFSLNHFRDNLPWFEDFPTVVRIGNFVFCMKNRDQESTYYVRPRYRLVDVVPDPEKPEQLQGKNVAWPYILNVGNDGFSPPQKQVKNNIIDKTYTSTTLNGPIYWLETINRKNFDDTNFDLGPGFYNSTYHVEGIYPKFDDNGKWIGSHMIDTGSGQVIWGVGDYMTHRVDSDINSKTFTYSGIASGNNYKTRLWFAPVVDVEQFHTIYGEERLWGRPETTDRNWLYRAYPEQQPVTAQFPNGINYFPFEIEQVKSNPVYNDVADDVTGDGESDTQVKVAAAATFLSLAKCSDNPALDGINDALSSVKDKINAAVSSTGLLDLVKTADQLSGALEAGLKKLSPSLTLQDALNKLDITDPEAIAELKEKWGNVVPDIDGLLANFNLPDFDICGTKKIQAKENEDGTLEALPEPPIEPPLPVEAPADIPLKTVEVTLPIDEPVSEEFPDITKRQATAAFQELTTRLDKIMNETRLTAEEDIKVLFTDITNLKQEQEYKDYIEMKARKRGKVPFKSVTSDNVIDAIAFREKRAYPILFLRTYELNTQRAYQTHIINQLKLPEDYILVPIQKQGTRIANSATYVPVLSKNINFCKEFAIAFGSAVQAQILDDKEYMQKLLAYTKIGEGDK